MSAGKRKKVTVAQDDGLESCRTVAYQIATGVEGMAAGFDPGDAAGGSARPSPEHDQDYLALIVVVGDRAPVVSPRRRGSLVGRDGQNPAKTGCSGMEKNTIPQKPSRS